MNINSSDSGLLRIYKLNDNQNTASLQITSFDKGSNLQKLPDTSAVLSQISQNSELEHYATGKAYQGNVNIVLPGSSKMADKMDGILNRLDEDSQKHLIDSGLMTNEKFLDLASELDDEELQQLSETLQGMDTPTTLQLNTPYSEIKGELIDALSSANDATRSKILQQTAQYAEKVVPNSDDATYDSMGRIMLTSSSNDLHSFISSLNKTEDVNGLMDKLNSFDEEQQSQLLNVMSLDYDLGERLLEQVSGKDKDIQDNILNFVGEIAATSSRMESRDFEGHNMPGTLYSGTIPGSDNHFADVSKEMIEDTVSLLENHDFTDDQLLQMGEELNSMERIDQRAYLAITKVGLEQLVGDNSLDQESNKLSQALESISALRSDSNIREEVFRARYGVANEPGSKFLGTKDKYDADLDMNAAIISLFSQSQV